MNSLPAALNGAAGSTPVPEVRRLTRQSELRLHLPGKAQQIFILSLHECLRSFLPEAFVFFVHS